MKINFYRQQILLAVYLPVYYSTVFQAARKMRKTSALSRLNCGFNCRFTTDFLFSLFSMWEYLPRS